MWSFIDLVFVVDQSAKFANGFMSFQRVPQLLFLLSP